MSDQPLHKTDPEAWQAYLAEGNATQPRKRVASDVLIRDTDGLLLLVDPAYKPGWDLPGGMVENNESPRQAGRRELAEELGLDLLPGRALCIEWVPPHGAWDDSVAFIFDGGVLDQSDQPINIDANEIRQFQFIDLAQAIRFVRPRLATRLRSAFEALHQGRTAYGEPDSQPFA